MESTTEDVLGAITLNTDYSLGETIYPGVGQWSSFLSEALQVHTLEWSWGKREGPGEKEGNG